MDRTAKLSLLADMALAMNEDELDVLLEVAQGCISVGRKNYGPLKLSGDERDFVRETAEEIRDGLFYMGCKLRQFERLTLKLSK